MTLSSRALLLILPVVLASYALGATAVYLFERSQVIRLEQTYLQQGLDRLAILYENEETVARSVLTSLVSTSAFRLFLQESDESFRANALASRMEGALRSLATDPDEFISLSVFSQEMQVVYYGENSADPFASIDPVLIAHARDVLNGTVGSGATTLVEGARGPLLVIGRRIDPVTMSEPVGARDDLAFQVQVAIRPGRFVAAILALEATYGSHVELLPRPLVSSSEIAATTRIENDLFAHLDPSEDYFGDRMRTVGLLLAAGVVVMSLLTVGLLILLVRRFITLPVTELDQQVTEVVNGTRYALQSHGPSGEVGRLSQNVKKLHDTVAASLTEVRRSSYMDTLTGLSNRAHFHLLASAAIARSLQEGQVRTLLFLDIDHFKFVNDRFGHEAGDRLLKALSAAVLKVLTAGSWKPDVVARLSGDEFAALLPTSADEASAVAERIVALFAGGFPVDGQRYPIGMSIGSASCPDQGSDLDDLVANADAAMYEAKARGRNAHVRFSDDISDLRRRTRQIRSELASLEPDDEFHLVYMPIVDRAGSVVSCEALLRWRSPALGSVRPDEFVPIAERNGLFDKIDDWVIDRSLRDWRELDNMFGPRFILSINVSSAQLCATTLLTRLEDLRSRHGVPAERIMIEFTETFAVERERDPSANIAVLRARGYRVAIDDFGAGFTSIRQIIDYRADTIKLDREFLDGLMSAGATKTLNAVIDLCHAEGLAVVAEGIDSAQKERFLLDAGCDLFQGFGILPPASLHDLRSWEHDRTSVRPALRR